jgi:DNA-directed RNA polymerase sigma subunit (sigma70/sigma32)
VSEKEQLRCPNPECGKEVQVDWKWCPYCRTGLRSLHVPPRPDFTVLQVSNAAQIPALMSAVFGKDHGDHHWDDETMDMVRVPYPMPSLEVVRYVMGLLKPDQAQILIRRLDLDGGGVRTLAAIGREVELSGNAIRSREAKGLSHLRHPNCSRFLQGKRSIPSQG